MNPPTVGGKFAAKDVEDSVPDAPGGVKTPPYDAKDKGDTMARLRAGHARPLRTTVNGLRTKGARGRQSAPTVGGKFAAKDVGGGVPDAPRRGQDPSLRCKPVKEIQWQGCGPGMPGPYGLL